MSEAPWLTIIGLGEDGLDALPPASRGALSSAEVIMGPPRHLAHLGQTGATQVEWPVPFSDGLDRLAELRGRATVVLVSGDPFWFGAGSVLARHFDGIEWTAHPAPSIFSRAAAHLGWPLETTACLGLHAVPLARMKPHLGPGARLIVTLRDGTAVSDLGAFLSAEGFGASEVTVMQALGGSNARIATCLATDLPNDFGHPVCAAISVAGEGAVLPLTSGLPDDVFETDGVMTKRPLRALTLSTLAPRHGELLWDIGGGSGSIGVEWLLADPSLRCISFEPRADRASLIRANARRLGQDRLELVIGQAPEILEDRGLPDAVFIGGGLSSELLAWLETCLPPRTRLVANAVSLDSEALLTQAHARLGGDLMRIEIARAAPMGEKRGWKSAYPVVQWSVTL